MVQTVIKRRSHLRAWYEKYLLTLPLGWFALLLLSELGERGYLSRGSLVGVEVLCQRGAALIGRGSLSVVVETAERPASSFISMLYRSCCCVLGKSLLLSRRDKLDTPCTRICLMSSWFLVLSSIERSLRRFLTMSESMVSCCGRRVGVDGSAAEGGGARYRLTATGVVQLKR